AARAHEVLEPPAPRFGVLPTAKPPVRMTEARAKVLAALAGGPSSGASRHLPPEGEGINSAAAPLSLGEREAAEGRRVRASGPEPIAKSALAELAGCSVGVIDGLVREGALALVELPPEKPANLDPDF